MRIDLNLVKSEALRLATENPNYIYPSTIYTDGCSYVADAVGATTGKGCLIGQALQNSGVPRDLLADIEAEHGSLSFNELLEVLEDLGHEVDSSDEDAYSLAIAQEEQDASIPWGELRMYLH